MMGGLYLGVYGALTHLGEPVISAYLRRRAAAGKEDPERAGERRGLAARPRPPGPLVWVHAASVGESLSVLSLIERLLADRPGLAVLVTTGTVTSARLMAERLPAGAFHQYVPADRGPWVARFLDHWRPDLALWVESELWPNLLAGCRRHGLPLIMVNGRMSRRSFARWRRHPAFARTLLDCFALCLAQSAEDAERLTSLGAPRTVSVGNLKFAAAPLPADAAELARLQAALGERPRWLAASTHPGEEARLAEAQRQLKERHKALLILVPRHPARGEAVAEELAGAGFRTARRALGQAVGADIDVYVADSMGELGLFYRLADIVFVGGSLVPHGGQNLLEPAQLDCALLHGPHMHNFRAIVEEMRAAGATTQVWSSVDLALAVDVLMSQPALRHSRIRAAREVATAKRGTLDAVVRELGPWLDALAREAAQAPPEAPASGAGRHARA